MSVINGIGFDKVIFPEEIREVAVHISGFIAKK